MPFRWLRDIDGDDPADILISTPCARPPQYDMDRFGASLAYNQTALTPRVLRVRFQHLPLHESCLDFCHIEIFLKSLLLGMDAEFVLPLSDQPLDGIDVQMCASSHWLLSSRADVNFTRTLCGEPAGG